MMIIITPVVLSHSELKRKTVQGQLSDFSPAILERRRLQPGRFSKVIVIKDTERYYEHGAAFIIDDRCS